MKSFPGCLPQVEDLIKEFGPKDYQTSTRGQRSVEAVRTLGEGMCWANTEICRLVPALHSRQLSTDSIQDVFYAEEDLQTFLKII